MGRSTESEKKVLPLKIYPNPTSDFINFNHPFKDVQLFNILGQKTERYIQINKFKIKISGLQKRNVFYKRQMERHHLHKKN